MQTARGKAFMDNEPTIGPTEPAEALSSGRSVLSLKAAPVLSSPNAIAYIALKLVLENGTTEIIALDQLAGEGLLKVLQTISGLGWKTDALTPAPVKH